ALAVLRQVDEQTPPSLRSVRPDVPAWLEALVARLMAKSPDDRFQSAAEVAALLERCLAHLLRPDAPAPEVPPAPRRAFPARRVPVALLVAALMLPGALLAAAMLVPRETRSAPIPGAVRPENLVLLGSTTWLGAAGVVLFAAALSLAGLWYALRRG